MCEFIPYASDRKFSKFPSLCCGLWPELWEGVLWAEFTSYWKYKTTESWRLTSYFQKKMPVGSDNLSQKLPVWSSWISFAWSSEVTLRSQNVAEARNLNALLRKASGIDWVEPPKSEDMCGRWHGCRDGLGCPSPSDHRRCHHLRCLPPLGFGLALVTSLLF